MMFEYNGNLLEVDRINLVAKEITDKYPQISIEKAKEAAMLEGKISSNKTVNDELNRLYNIMLVNCESKNIVTLIYKDFLKLLKEKHIEEDNNYIYLVEGINNYLQNYAEFPFLSDYQ
ncbi:MAG: hypothetical protein SO067_00735 [Bacilli bacterium]|nr:hypothetical protein [Bacilli bacterium]